MRGYMVKTVLFLMMVLLSTPSHAFDASGVERVVDNLLRANGGRVKGVRVIQSDYMNAWIYDDGWIAVTSGLLKIVHDEDELAFIIAHEMAHLDMERARVLGFSGLTGEEKMRSELEADRIAVTYLERAGYRPRKAIDLLQRMAGHSFRDRIEALKTLLEGR